MGILRFQGHLLLPSSDSTPPLMDSVVLQGKIK